MEAQPVYTALLCRQQSLLCAEQGHPKSPSLDNGTEC